MSHTSNPWRFLFGQGIVRSSLLRNMPVKSTQNYKWQQCNVIWCKLWIYTAHCRQTLFLQCFDTVGWATGRASSHQRGNARSEFYVIGWRLWQPDDCVHWGSDMVSSADDEQQNPDVDWRSLKRPEHSIQQGTEQYYHWDGDVLSSYLTRSECRLASVLQHYWLMTGPVRVRDQFKWTIEHTTGLIQAIYSSRLLIDRPRLQEMDS